MPSDPPVGSYEFLGWQTEPDGGDTVDANTHVVADLDVYAAKGTAGEGHAQAYHVMSATDKRANALAVEVADHYNQQHGTDYGVESFTCTSIAVNGTDSSTNHLYSVNKWENQNEYYYVYNVGNPGGIDDLYNERVPVNEVQGITVYGEVDGDDYAQFIPVSELSLVETQNNVVVEIRVREKLDGITKELVASAQEVPAGLEPSDYSYPDGDRHHPRGWERHAALQAHRPWRRGGGVQRDRRGGGGGAGRAHRDHGQHAGGGDLCHEDLHGR